MVTGLLKALERADLANQSGGPIVAPQAWPRLSFGLRLRSTRSPVGLMLVTSE